MPTSLHIDREFGQHGPALRHLVDAGSLACGTLINADLATPAEDIVVRCRMFADQTVPNAGALIITLLAASPPGLDHLASHQRAAALWSFTQVAALDWAARGIRVNAIGLGASPAGPFEATEQSGRMAASMPAVPATPEDVARTIRAMAAWPSMTGQIVRLGV